MTRDNEKILEICADLSSTVRLAAIELMQADCPSEMVVDLLNSIRVVNNAADYLSVRGHGPNEYAEPRAMVEGSSLGAAMAEALKPVSDRLDALIAKTERGSSDDA